MKVLLAALLAFPCLAQKLYVYSEFTRIDPFGAVVAADRGAAPRHILSPGVPRNAYSSFRVVVYLDKPGKFYLDIAQNPDTFKPTLYKERFEKYGSTWIPDKLEPVKIPYSGTAEDFAIPGQKVVTFWLDIWTDRSAPVDRSKLEPQLWLSSIDEWIIYPMEVRVLSPVASGIKLSTGTLPLVTDRSDAAVAGPARELFCGQKEGSAPPQPTARSMIRRNVKQHLAMTNVSNLKALLMKQGIVDPCATPTLRAGTGPEWYLRFRDALFRSMGAE